MAISGIIQFHASSGARSHPYQLDPFVAGSGTEWNRIGFFGSTGPGSFVTVSTYQDTTYACNESGIAPNIGVNTYSGILQNLKYVNSASVNPNGSGSVALSTITAPDATLRVRFTNPSGTAVQTQNAKILCVQLGATSGVASESALVSGITVQVFEVVVDSSWTQISQTGTNSKNLGSRATNSIIHDYHLGISVSPINTGEKKDFAFLFKLEYL